MTDLRERLSAFGLGLLLAIGAGVLWGIAVALGWAFIEECLLARDNRISRLHVLKDGTLISSAYSGSIGRWTYRKLDGTVTDNSPGFVPETYLAAPPRGNPQARSLTWAGRIVQLYGPQKANEVWYFVHDGKPDGRGCFVGYDIDAKHKIGYIGRDGFSQAEPPADEQFPVSIERMGNVSICYLPWYEEKDHRGAGFGSIPFLIADDGLIRIDVQNRTTSTCWKGEGLIYAAQVAETLPSEPRWVDSRSILLRTRDQVLVLDLRGRQKDAYPIPPELRTSEIEWHQVGKDRVLMCNSNDYKEEVFWLDTATKDIRRQQLGLGVPSKSAVRKFFEDDVLPALAVPSPGAFVLVAFWRYWINGHPANMGEIWACVYDAWARLWLSLLIAGAISIVLAGVCYRRQRRYGLPWTWVWTGFVLLFGLPAYFGYLAHRSWPARPACPNCGKPAPRDRPACFACGRDFPQPTPKGIEIFA